MFVCAAETAKSPEDDSGGPDERTAVFLWRGRGRDGAAPQSSSHEEPQVRLEARAPKLNVGAENGLKQTFHGFNYFNERPSRRKLFYREVMKRIKAILVTHSHI